MLNTEIPKKIVGGKVTKMNLTSCSVVTMDEIIVRYENILWPLFDIQQILFFNLLFVRTDGVPWIKSIIFTNFVIFVEEVDQMVNIFLISFVSTIIMIIIFIVTIFIIISSRFL